ncbi:hypothetical protein MSG28_002059 [Choristoneura fumiferana]|uniref:Uncharacterized protein n=1 Tax=Choristoneura fumiferana TaxID=7141 RepID=A0ACC0JTV3_CHOFU|nr:hypothetical protein MSG28_002059 [Choristoneura fumiferana]
MEVRCKCHGLSGSCQLRTCWRATPDFRVVASTIKRQYRKVNLINMLKPTLSLMELLLKDNLGPVTACSCLSKLTSALIVAQEELNNGLSVLRGRPRGRRRSRARPAPKTSLLFFEKSPSFCEADPKTESAGTSGRVCRIGRTSRSGSCDLLCCGRGHALIRKSSIKPCNCTFHWCCRVDCQRCRDDKWVAVSLGRAPGEVALASRPPQRRVLTILRDFTKHPNLVDFYGVFCERSEGVKKIWFVLELCECGSVIDIVRKLNTLDRKMSEEHIAYVLKYTIKALVYLHENKVLHRNLRCSNILVTKDGEVKLSDFGLSTKLNSTMDKAKTNIGSPSWMAPEVVISGDGYGNRADVWALGITTIEMADAKAPFQDMHPTRALFQIVRNPPPSVSRACMWSNDFNDFVTECLEKNPEHRPYVMELEEHPFIQSVPENDFHLTTELKILAFELKDKEIPSKTPERIIKNGLLTTEGDTESETMQVEDLAALEVLTEDSILAELQTKLAKGSFTSFIGDILLILNPNTNDDIYNEDYHIKYECKSRSDNEPHIFAVADGAYQDALHHNEPQHIVFSGESKSGKTTNMNHALRHLTHLGAMKNNTADRIERAKNVIQVAISAGTPINSHSTRAIFQIQVTYGSSGKLSGAIFWLYQLEKWRVSSTDMSHANFDLFYYFYDAMEAGNRLDEFSLEKNRKHRYLRIQEEPKKAKKSIRETPEDNVAKYQEFIENLKTLDWEQEDIIIFETILSAILILGNVRFKDGKNGSAEIENPEEAKKVAKLLSLEEVKFLWALLNYCLIESGTAVKRKHSTDEARDARDMLASTIRTSCKGPYIKLSGSHEFSVAHYTGKVSYDAREIADKNKDFLPPEMIETMRASINTTVQQFFRNKLTKTGNLTVSSSQPKVAVVKSKSEKEMENSKARKYNTVSKGQFSQVHRMRTAAATYRATSLEILKQLSTGPGSGGTHYVRCIRADLNDNPRGFQTEVVRQQLRALAILDTAKARQNGFSCRIPFAEFIRRYRFLAFDFDENVDVTKDNCRLLLIRLKMEGWELGKTKVFLKYYNEEFLARLYETQVKKIVKVQCMMRAFLARRKAIKSKSKAQHIKELKKQQSMNVTEDDAALLIQKEALLNTSTSVLLDRVDPHAKATDFLGSGPPTVWKLPFRIDQLQYYDTSYMCDPATKSSDTFASQYDSDHEQWDEPLKRRFSSAQTEPSMTTTGTQTLINVPFCRDPTQPVPKLPPEEPPKVERNPSKKDANRPAVYKKKPNYSTHSAYYQPPAPWTGTRDDDDVLEDSSPMLRKNNFSRSLYGVNSQDMNNPIRELQAMAKSTNDLNEDDPPFNFQAMLKKTPRNRASMKRSGETDNGLWEDKPEVSRAITPKKTPVKAPAPQPPRSASREFVRKDSRELITSALKNKSSTPDLMCQPPVIDNKTPNERVEIAPGITVEGTFSWHEIGYYDLPAMIDYVIKNTKVSKLQYVGFSQGTTAFWVMASTRPEYNDKISAMQALAPIARQFGDAMSFITKRERVFNEYDLVDLPPRNEGKLKAYASCTDARAWSHFCSSKSEHLTEIIKRNNDMTVTPKYVPTKVIVDTIMVSKNMEIGRLKRKIEEFEQLLAVYDDLDLDCDQKCEIAKQGIDSEAFETGKSRGDALTYGGDGAGTASLPQEETSPSLILMDENQSLKEQIKNLQDIEDEYQEKLFLINELKGEIEVWKNSFEKASEHNKYLEECIESYRDERQRLEKENKLLLQSVKDKTAAVENLMEVIAKKSLEINKSTDENENLVNKLHKLKESYEDHENVLSDLKEQVCARDDKIAIMQNNINALEDEVRGLLSSLKQAVDTGFEIKDNSFHNFDESRQQLEAHHSKATHNIKMELAMLQDDNKIHSGPRCQTKSYSDANKDWCGEKVYNPIVSDVVNDRNDSLNTGEDGKKIVQLQPQAMKIKVRPGQQFNFTVKYRPAKDYPLDVYYLMDYSYTMKKYLELLQKQGNEIYERLSDLTNNVRLGVGSFIEKPGLPFASPFQKAYAFQNHLALTNDMAKFSSVILDNESGSNLDDPEAGLDALMQAMVCKERLAWRDGARKIIVLCTDSTYHSAGDGKIVGAAKLNDMQCHLDDNDVYNLALEQDYPTVNQINKIALQENTVIIFNTLNRVQRDYTALADRIHGARYVELKNESNIVETITQEYLKAVSNLEMDVVMPNHIRVQLTPDCTKVATCGVEHHKEFTISVAVTATWCLSGNNVVTIKPMGLGEKLTIHVETACECECEKHGIPNSEECTNNGTYQCGTCTCNENSCGTCTCDTGFSGAKCEYDDNGCLWYQGRLCNGRGKCKYNLCQCQDGWTGDDCHCSTDTDSCRAPHSKGVCSGNGNCECGACICTSVDSANKTYTGPFCENCFDCDEKRCRVLEEYVQCVYFKDKKECDEKFNSSGNVIDWVNGTEINAPKYHLAKLCKTVLEDGKSIVFKHKYEERILHLIIQKELEEPDRANMWIQHYIIKKQMKAYAFQNHLALTNDMAKFSSVILDNESGSNLDDPEAGLDALMQAMVCSGNGNCECGACICTSVDSANKTYTGPFCENCFDCDEKRCRVLEEYVQCVYFKDKKECDEKFNSSGNVIDWVNGTEINAPKYHLAKLCKTVLEDGKSIVFKHKYEERILHLIIQKELEEPDRANMWIAIGTSIGGIILLGLLAVVAWKILMDIHDAREFEKFKKMLDEPADMASDNPLFKGPTINFENPAYKRRSRMH